MGKTEEGAEEPCYFHPGRRGLNEDLGHASQIGLLEQKLEIVRQMNHESARVAIPVDKCYGWWKVASASMQVPGWKIPDKPLVDSLSFRPSCLSTEGDGDTRLNPVTVAKQRLLELENAIERRYLKAPLGQTKDATLQHITEKERQADKDESMDVDDEEEEEEEEEVKENGVDKNGKPDAEEDTNKSEETNGDGEDKDEEKKD